MTKPDFSAQRALFVQRDPLRAAEHAANKAMRSLREAWLDHAQPEWRTLRCEDRLDPGF